MKTINKKINQVLILLSLLTVGLINAQTITAKSSNASVYSTSTIRVNRTTTYLENGTYCLKLKGTSSYLDHQGGTSNGTNVHLWSGDGNSNNNQKIVIDDIIEEKEEQGTEELNEAPMPERETSKED